MIKFEIGKEYGVRAFSNYEFIIKERIISRTAKTVKTESGKTLRVSDKYTPGIEQMWPDGPYGPVIAANEVMQLIG